MIATSTLPCINPNPDIAGIGVRISVYSQAFLNLICAIIFAKDGWISSYEHSILTTTSTNLFVTGCALLVCSFVQAGTLGFSVYHALIVLNLSWIISLSALLYVVIYALNLTLPLNKIEAPGAEEKETSSASIIVLSVFHLSGIGALGIWVWAKIPSFGDQPECTPDTFLTIFGHDILVTQQSLRKGSLGVYSMAAVPFLNLFIVVIAGLLVTVLLTLAYCALRVAGLPKGWRRFVLVSGVVAMALLEVLFIVDTELVIARSSGWVKAGESQWSFGQTLALLMVVVPLFETVKAGVKSWKEGSSIRAGEARGRPLDYF